MASTTTPTSRTTPSEIGGTVHEYRWTWQGQPFTVVYETLGQGSPVLLLPAFSTVSTRGEMRVLAERLAPQFQVIALDWLGFGHSERPALDYQPALYHQLLQDFVQLFDQPLQIIAAGHAAGYAMQLVNTRPDRCSKVVLVAPTWQGPLRVMGAPSHVAVGVRQMVRSPLLGQALYKLNTAPSFLKWMYQRHVYVDTAHLTPDFIQHKHQTTQQPGARFAPAAFVTAALDPVSSRAAFLQLFQSVSIPVMVIIGEQSPAASRAEMEALAELPGLIIKRLPGTLGLHEEYAAEVAEMVLPFLQK
jgi:pimeloyl-ACP methyl ester carboxylesterase